MSHRHTHLNWILRMSPAMVTVRSLRLRESRERTHYDTRYKPLFTAHYRRSALCRIGTRSSGTYISIFCMHNRCRMLSGFATPTQGATHNLTNRPLISCNTVFSLWRDQSEGRAHCENNDSLGIARLVPVAREDGEGMTNPKRPRGFRENCSIAPLQHKIYRHSVCNQHNMQSAD